MAAATALVVLGATASAGAAPTVAGTNSITVHDTAGMRVTLPKALSFSPDNPPTFTFEGDTPWATVSLYALDAQAARSGAYHPMLTATTEREFGSTWVDALPAGDYILVLTSAPGQAVKATLKVPGLDGTATFTPTTPFPIHHRVRPPRPSQVEDNTVVVSAMNPTRGAGFGILTEFYTESLGWMGSDEHCLYGATNREDQPTDAEPGCPGGKDTSLLQGPRLPLSRVEIADGAFATGSFWSYNQPIGYGEGWNYHTFSGDPPDIRIETTWLDFADAPTELVSPGCAVDAGSVAPDICANFAPFRRAKRNVDLTPGPLPSYSAHRFGLRRDVARRIARTKLGALYLVPGREWSCAVMYSKVGAGANCQPNRRVLRGQLAFTESHGTDRMLIAVSLPDGASRVRLKLRGRARGSARLGGNAAIAYTSQCRYRGGQLRWRDASGRQRTTKLPYVPVPRVQVCH